MDANTIISVISSLGFPIAMCAVMAYYIKYIGDRYSKERDDLNKQHDQELGHVMDALNNNTIALTTLCERIEKYDN